MKVTYVYMHNTLGAKLVRAQCGQSWRTFQFEWARATARKNGTELCVKESATTTTHRSRRTTPWLNNLMDHAILLELLRHIRP